MLFLPICGLLWSDMNVITSFVPTLTLPPLFTIHSHPPTFTHYHHHPPTLAHSRPHPPTLTLPHSSLPTPHRKLTLENLYWSVFESESEREDNGRQFVQLVQEQLSKPSAEVGHCHSVCKALVKWWD